MNTTIPTASLTPLQAQLLSAVVGEPAGYLTQAMACFLLRTSPQAIGRAAMVLSRLNLVYRDGHNHMWPVVTSRKDPLVPTAEAFARKAHEARETETPFVRPEAVAAALDKAGETEEVVAVGWLHDVLDNSPLTSSALYFSGFPSLVVQAIGTISHSASYTRHTRYDQYIEQVSLCPIARRVKIAVLQYDLADKPSREAASRYRKALKVLKQAQEKAYVYQSRLIGPEARVREGDPEYEIILGMAGGTRDPWFNRMLVSTQTARDKKADRARLRKKTKGRAAA